MVGVDGICSKCEETVKKASALRHLKKCIAHPKGINSLVLRVDADRGPDYWLYIVAQPSARLSSIDRILREEWLECCGHLSMFTSNGGDRTCYSSHPDEYFDQRSMNVKVSDVMYEGDVMDYDYDFGTTTQLRITARAVIPVKKKRPSARVVMRNLPVQYKCTDCEAYATQVCRYCMWEEETGGYYCDACAKKHQNYDEDAADDYGGEHDMGELHNSPRHGMCGY